MWPLFALLNVLFSECSFPVSFTNLLEVLFCLTNFLQPVLQFLFILHKA